MLSARTSAGSTSATRKPESTWRSTLVGLRHAGLKSFNVSSFLSKRFGLPSFVWMPVVALGGLAEFFVMRDFNKNKQAEFVYAPPPPSSRSCCKCKGFSDWHDEIKAATIVVAGLFEGCAAAETTFLKLTKPKQSETEPVPEPTLPFVFELSSTAIKGAAIAQAYVVGMTQIQIMGQAVFCKDVAFEDTYAGKAAKLLNFKLPCFDSDYLFDLPRLAKTVLPLTHTVMNFFPVSEFLLTTMAAAPLTALVLSSILVSGTYYTYLTCQQQIMQERLDKTSPAPKGLAKGLDYLANTVMSIPDAILRLPIDLFSYPLGHSFVMNTFQTAVGVFSGSTMMQNAQSGSANFILKHFSKATLGIVGGIGLGLSNLWSFPALWRKEIGKEDIHGDSVVVGGEAFISDKFGSSYAKVSTQTPQQSAHFVAQPEVTVRSSSTASTPLLVPAQADNCCVSAWKKVTTLVQGGVDAARQFGRDTGTRCTSRERPTEFLQGMGKGFFHHVRGLAAHERDGRGILVEDLAGDESLSARTPAVDMMSSHSSIQA
ncbi:hypothetical protein BH10PSE19_BH10PSE19_11940 [soil metagenome]